MTSKKMTINNIDIMIVSEEPKINPHYEKIVNSISKLLKTNKKNIEQVQYFKQTYKF